MNDGHDREVVGTDEVDDSIVSKNKFPDMVLLCFGDFSAKFKMVEEFLGGGDDFFGKLLGIGRGIFSN